MPSYSDTFVNYITRVREYLAEPNPLRSRWTDSFLKRLFNAQYRRRVTQLVMAHEGAYINEVKMVALTSSTVFTNTVETFDQAALFTALNAQTTLSADSSIKIQGKYSLNLNKASGNATVGFSKTYPAPISFSTAYNSTAYISVYPTANPAVLTTSGVQIKLGYDAANYYQWNIDPTALNIAAWNTLTLNLSSPTLTVGAPNLGAVLYFEVNLVFTLSTTVYTGFKFDNFYFTEKPDDYSFYPWPVGFERLVRLELETTDQQRIPLTRDERAARSVSRNSQGFVGNFPTYRPVNGGFVLEPPLSDSSSITYVVLGYNGTPAPLINDNDKLSGDFPVSYDELLVLDTAMAAMDSESLMESGNVRSLLRLRMEYDEDFLRYIDDRISSLRRIELADSYYEDS